MDDYLVNKLHLHDRDSVTRLSTKDFVPRGDALIRRITLISLQV